MEKCNVIALTARYPHELSRVAGIRWRPVLRISPIEGSSLEVLDALGYCDVIAFTSPRGPRILAEDARRFQVYNRLRSEMLKRVRATIGPVTSRALRESFGLNPNVVPKDRYTSEELVREILRLEKSCLLFARSRLGNKEVLKVISEKGVVYRDVAVYDETVDIDAIKDLTQDLEGFIVVLTSPLIARAFCSVLKPGEKPLKVIAIGQGTLNELRRSCSLKLSYIIPERYTYDGISKVVARLC